MRSFLGVNGVMAAAMLFATQAYAQDPPAAPPVAPPASAPPPSVPAAVGAVALPPPAVPPPNARPARFRAVAPKRAAWVPRGKRVRDLPIVPGLPIASFPGFARLEDGQSRIFIEVNSKVDVAERRDAGRIVYRLRGTAVTASTNALPLITDYFSTPVERVQLVQDGTDVNVVIQLRETAEAKFQVVETPRGIVLWVDFPRSASFGRGDVTARDGVGVEVDRPVTGGRLLTTTQRLGSVQSPSSVDPPPAAR